VAKKEQYVFVQCEISREHFIKVIIFRKIC
jgi:hypothetical protein